MGNLLEVRDLRTSVVLPGGVVAHPVDGVSLDVPRGRTVGLVGESGCGKSMTARSVMGLLDGGARVDAGSIEFDGIDLLACDERAMCDIRGNRVAMVFQEPMTALNPSMKVGNQVREALLLHHMASRREARELVVRIFREVGIPEPERRYDAYPHQLSGGLRQRVCIAMAMVCRPELLIADEPTTALDVTVEAQILRLMRGLQAETGMSVLMITHNLGVVAAVCDEVNVMYAGQIVECATKEQLFSAPGHPYTHGLMSAIPRIHGSVDAELAAIPGTVPALGTPLEGCRFAGRCPLADARCRASAPELEDVGGGHLVRCHRHGEVAR